MAKEIVFLTFGEKWLPILPVFYVLSIAAFFNNLIGLASPVLNSLNKPQILRNNRLIQFGFFVILVYPFTKVWGLVGISLVMVVFSLVSLNHYIPILAREINHFYPYTLKTLMKILPCTMIMMAVVYFMKGIFPVNFFWLFVLVLLGVVIYFAPIWFLDKDLKWDVQEGWSVFKEKLGL